MTIEESLRRFGIVPTDESLPIIRKLLAREAAAERAGQPREDDLALLCCVQLFSRGLLEDVLPIWDAKQSGMDLGCVIDVEFLCGAGIDETKRFLAGHPSASAADALAYIEECESGHFAAFCAAEHLYRYKEYFGVV